MSTSKSAKTGNSAKTGTTKKPATTADKRANALKIKSVPAHVFDSKSEAAAGDYSNTEGVAEKLNAELKQQTGRKTAKPCANRFGKIKYISIRLTNKYRKFQSARVGDGVDNFTYNAENNGVRRAFQIQYISHTSRDEPVVIPRDGLYADCLNHAVRFRNFLDPKHPELVPVAGYCGETDMEDLLRFAGENIFSISTPYGIIKWMLSNDYIDVIKSKLASKIRECDDIVKAEEGTDKYDEHEDYEREDCTTYLSVIHNGTFLKRVQVMAERLWHILNSWPVTVPPNVVIQAYVGVGNKPSNANFMQFIVPVLEGYVTSIGERGEIVTHHCHDDIRHCRDKPGAVITSNFFVSSSYSFNAACNPNFLRQLYYREGEGSCNMCMLEILMPSGKKLPYIGSSTNEAEILFKPGDTFRYLRRYNVTNRVPDNSVKGLITVYQYELIDDNNPIINEVNYSLHPSWKIKGDKFIRAVSAATGVDAEIPDSQPLNSEFEESQSDGSQSAGGNALKNKITLRMRMKLINALRGTVKRKRTVKRRQHKVRRNKSMRRHIVKK